MKPSSPEDGALRRLQRAVASAAPMELVFWDRGGPPGPGYESDHLTLRDEGRALTAVVRRTRFDDRVPTFHTEEATSTFPRLRGTEKLVAAIFGRRHAEETDPRVGGGTRITISARALAGADAGAEASKTFFERLPQELAPLDRRFREMIEAALGEAPPTVALGGA